MEWCVQRSPKRREGTELFQRQLPRSTTEQQHVTPMFLLMIDRIQYRPTVVLVAKVLWGDPTVSHNLTL